MEESRAGVELEIAIEDFMHWYDFGPDANGAVSSQSLRDVLERHALALHRIFVIRDADGNPLPSEPFRFRFDWPGKEVVTLQDLRSMRVKYSSHFSFPPSPRFLIFQLSMGSDCPSVFWQAILSVHGSMPTDRGQVLRLTSQGNAETIELVWSHEVASVLRNEVLQSSCLEKGVAGLKQICANINVGTESIDVQITIPITLLQTWFALPGNDDEFLDPDEQQSARSRIEPLLTGALSVESAGRKHSGKIVELEFLPLAPPGTEPPVERHRLSVFAGRVSATLMFGPFTDLEQADFQWHLFNNAVVSVVATMDSNGSITRHEFSTYHPKYHWTRG